MDDDDWGDLHQSLATTLTSPDVMGQHPDLNTNFDAGGRFRGEESIKAYTGDVGDAYQSAMEKAGVPAQMIQSNRQLIEADAQAKARDHILKQFSNHPIAGGESPYEFRFIPGLGHLIGASQDIVPNESMQNIAAGKGDYGDYASVGRYMGDQQRLTQHGRARKVLDTALAIGQFGAEVAATGGLGGEAAGAGLASKLGFGALGTRIAGAAGATVGATGIQTAGTALSGGFANRPLPEVLRDVGADFVSNAAMIGIGGFARAGKEIPPEVTQRVGQYVVKTLKALAGMEAGGDVNKVIGLSDRAGPLMNIALAKPEDRQRAVQDALGQGLGVALFEGAMDLSRGGAKLTPENIVQQALGKQQAAKPDLSPGWGLETTPEGSTTPPGAETAQPTAPNASGARISPQGGPGPTPKEATTTPPESKAPLADWADEDVTALAKSLGFATNGKRQTIIDRMAKGGIDLTKIDQANQPKEVMPTGPTTEPVVATPAQEGTPAPAPFEPDYGPEGHVGWTRYELPVKTPSPVEKAFTDSFPGGRKTPRGDFQAEIGGKTVYAIHDPARNMVRIDFEKPSETGVPAEMQAGSKELLTAIKGFAGKLKDAGQGIEYLARDNRGQETMARAQAAGKQPIHAEGFATPRAELYARTLNKAGFEQVAGPGVDRTDMYRWQPKVEQSLEDQHLNMIDALQSIWRAQGIPQKTRAHYANKLRPLAGDKDAFETAAQKHAEVGLRVVQSWIDNPREAPPTEEKQNAIAAANGIAQRFGIEPPSVRRSLAASLQGAHQAVRAPYETEGAGVQGGEGSAEAEAPPGVPEAARGQLGPNATPTQRALYARSNLHPWLKEDILRRSWGARTLGDEVKARGGLNLDSVKDFGEAPGDRLPKSLFSKNGVKLDEIADEQARFGITDEADFLDKLANHYLVEAGDWDQRIGSIQEAANAKEITDEIRRLHPEKSEAEVQSAAQESLRQADQDSVRTSRSRPAASEIEAGRAETGEDIEAGQSAQAAEAGATAGDADFPFGANEPGQPAAPLQQPNQPGRGSGGAGTNGPGRLGELAPGMGAAGGGSEESPPPPGTPGARGAEGPEGRPGAPPAKPFLQRLADTIKGLAQQTYPSLTRLSPKAGEALARASNARSEVEHTWNYIQRIIKAGGKALGDLSPEESRDVGATWLEQRTRHFRDELKKEGKDATKVGTFIGQDGSPLHSEADYQGMREVLTSFREAIKQEWTPLVESTYRSLMGLEPDEAINSKSQIPGLPLNAIAIQEGDPLPPAAGSGPGMQSLSNLRLRKPGFTKQAELNAPAYDLDVKHMMQRTLEVGVPAARRAEAVKTGLEEGTLQTVAKGERPPQGWKELMLQPAPGLPELPKGSRYFAHPDAFQEYVQGLGIGQTAAEQLGANATKGALGKLTQVTLLSPSELISHLVNHVGAMWRSGMGVPLYNLKDSISNAWKLYQQDPEMLRKVMNLAKISAAFEGRQPTGMLPEQYQSVDPSYHVNRFTTGLIDLMQNAVRVQLGDAYDSQVKSGRFPASETGKRDFINQAVGNYNTQASNPIVQFVKRLGLQPFAVAANTFTAQGIKQGTGLLGGGAINAPATDTASSLQLRAINIAKILPVLALGPVLNQLRYGNPFPQGVPPMAVKLDDKDGKTRFYDPLTITGTRRGLRATGMEALGEGLVGGKTGGQIFDKATADIKHSALHTVAGPVADFASIASSGENLWGYHVAGKAPRGSSQTWENLKAAIASVNPIAHAFLPENKREAGQPLSDRLKRLLGPIMPQERTPSRRR